MTKALIFIFITLSLAQCTRHHAGDGQHKTKYLTMSETNNGLSKATFGSGCFWCSEAIFTRLNGVVDVNSGYSGGTTKNPTYQEVSKGTTGHAEVVQLSFDPTKISYLQLLEVFFKTHDPTTLNRQGADIGTQYRSVIFYHDEAQRELAEAVKERLDNADIWDNPIVTEISPLRAFYLSEPYHHNYFARNPEQAYCQYVILPKIGKLEKLFGDLLREGGVPD